MEMLWSVLSDALLDCIRQLPFLFAAFMLIEALEHYQKNFTENILTKFDKAGPCVGAVLGCIPQCGFSVMAANLYAGGVVSLGTLFAVFMATSDEAILIIMGNPGQGKTVISLILCKMIIAVLAGYLVDLFLGRFIADVKWTGALCKDCGCNDHKHHKHKHTFLEHVVRPALRHTFKIVGFIFIFTFVLNFLMEVIGFERLSAMLLSDTSFQPFAAALLGLLPNCAASVALTGLYLDGFLTFPSVIAGLLSSAGVGWVVLFKVNTNKKESMRILLALYLMSALVGMGMSLFL